jgi:hypothetical protein
MIFLGLDQSTFYVDSNSKHLQKWIILDLGERTGDVMMYRNRRCHVIRAYPKYVALKLITNTPTDCIEVDEDTFDS